MFHNSKKRRGAIAPLAAILMVFLLGMVAFALDIGYILMAKTEAQTTADAAALAGMSKLMNLLQTASMEKGSNNRFRPVQTSDHLNLAREEVIAYANNNKIAGDTVEIQIADIEIGFMANPVSMASDVIETSGWPARPYNTVRVTVKRDDVHYGGKLTLIFGKMVGLQSVEITASATAAFQVGTPRFRGNYSMMQGEDLAQNYGGILPFTVEQAQWNALYNSTSTGTVSYTNFNGQTETMQITDNFKRDGTAGVDGNREIKMYPSSTTEGNFGTINFTLTKFGNSTQTLEDLIINGPSESDWPALTTILGATPTNPVAVNGDPGISGGMENAVQSIIGKPRILPIFSNVSGSGNNAYYNLIGFVPIRIVAADLSSGNKYIQFQPTVAVNRTNMGSTNSVEKRLRFDIVPGDGTNPDFSAIGATCLVR
jgi:hypothetical protein